MLPVCALTKNTTEKSTNSAENDGADTRKVIPFSPKEIMCQTHNTWSVCLQND